MMQKKIGNKPSKATIVASWALGVLLLLSLALVRADGPVALTGDWPAMWAVTDDDSQVYLFGTFHALPSDLQWKSDYFKSVMERTDVTYFEADTTSATALLEFQRGMQQYGLNPPGVTLSSLLGEQRAIDFKKVAEEIAGVPMAQLEPLRPWLAMITISMATFQKLGLQPSFGADMVIEQRAQQEGDELKYLESGLSQIKAMVSLDDMGDFAMIDETIDQMNNFEEEVNAMLSAWSKGDEQLMYESIVVGLKEVSEEAYKALFVNRNANWVTQIENLMEGEGDYLMAVGAGHLVGDESVVELLRAKGFTVSRVQ